MKTMITKSTPTYTNSGFKNVSQAAKKFLQKGFIKDPKKRPSAADLLKDPWLTKT